MKTISIILTSLLMSAAPSWAQWTDPGNDNTGNIYYDGGRVGIGTSSPQAKLEVKDKSIFLVDLSQKNTAFLRFGDQAVDDKASAKIEFAGWGIIHGGLRFIPRDTSNNLGKFVFSMGGGDDPEKQVSLLSIQQNGHVGIGTLNPNQPLHIIGQNALIENPSKDSAASWVVKNDAHAYSIGVSGVTNDNLTFYDNTVGKHRLVLDTSGNVGIGIPNPSAKLDVAGTTRTHVLTITGGADLAEPFNISSDYQAVEPGTVVVIDPEHPGRLKISRESYDPKVAGIVSGAGGIRSGLLLSQAGTIADGIQNVALSGRVYCVCDAANAPIEPGDLLTTSTTPGHAMKATNRDMTHGAVIGKAMTPLREGKGLVLVLVSLQ